ncbi:hypothetical protein A2454_02410 [Candidatus Peribacteria bacterium RIFOXYC2_FULL_55_14]|nr:MAG: hypothetical protein UY85_C0002G0008 [Candidatus Peribacteria bacterium GW2011_GWB1_54_5]KKW41114.1 MAG: hypothetical protein UY87_C0004G0024 [Candidatus Peribacteria bacterium GW2011_GWC2_54_8]KKW42188.1 MAG: hypothetical protein UY90_C0040G0009 [Candidatus Peregrinibacteria bacterium GW2011_GWA2_54_9]OGJ71290.1 MAG: hypothetical protein A2198_05810 [Candidatus Peribacteria bacterium RIFOXYA1_FULL_56_14]OGJ74367.1 MAG: hypothetical protein A2384_06595 [Candidatus Peribacteria bacterium
MGMRHLDGTEVHSDELGGRILAGELVWMERLLHYSGAEPEAGRVLTVTEDALRPGPMRRPYWQAVADFEARHCAELEAILSLDVARPLILSFRARFAYLFALAKELDTSEPIEEFDEEFQRYLDEIAAMIHELKYLVSERKPEGMTLQRAQELAESHVIARVWDSRRQLALVKQGTTLPIVETDGTLGEGRSRPAILEVGKVGDIEASTGGRARGFWFLPGYLRPAA